MTTILNDLHIGVQRKAGTTPNSQEAMRTWSFECLRYRLATADPDVLIAGDLFDTFEISPRDWLETYSVFSEWLLAGPERHLTLVAGNHDWSPRGSKVSSFQMLAKVLKGQFSRVTIIGIDEWDVAPSHAVLAHCSNQDIFNLKLSEVSEVLKSGMLLILHANYHNNFALESDHSLNVSEEQALELCNRGVRLVFAHEHQARRAIPHGMRADAGGEVIVMGNQWPTSISDCLGNDVKSMHHIRQDMEFDGEGYTLHPEVVWSRTDGGYTEVDWRDLGDAPEAHFIRVTGDASSNEAGEVINTLAKFRNSSSAFVISNAVRIEGIVQAEDLPATFEAAKAFDVMEFIKKHLDDDEIVAVNKLLEKRS